MSAPLPELWKSSADPLGETLHFLRMSGSFYCLSEFTGAARRQAANADGDAH